MPGAESATETNRPEATASADESSGLPHPAGRLTDALRRVIERAQGQPVSVAQLMSWLEDRGYALVLIILTLPFLFPLPTMGLSAPAGAAVALFGLAVMIGRPPWLPVFLARRQIAFSSLQKVVGAAERFCRRLERMLKPRLGFMLWPGVNLLIGMSLIFGGFFLSLPLPIPFSNAVPALAILLILAGLMERDGVFVLAGQLICGALFVLSCVIVYLIVTYGWSGAKSMLEGALGW